MVERIVKLGKSKWLFLDFDEKVNVFIYVLGFLLGVLFMFFILYWV